MFPLNRRLLLTPASDHPRYGVPVNSPASSEATDDQRYMSQMNPLAGKPAPPSILVDVPALRAAYFDLKPDASDPAQRVSFGTSGHRGSSFNASFNEAHILAITQAICEYRAGQGIDGPLFMGFDTHALSAPAFDTALEVLAANQVRDADLRWGVHAHAGHFPRHPGP